MADITLPDVQDLLARWWFNYDNGTFAQLPGLLTDDTRLQVRTDSGTTDYEEFVRADVSGRDDVMAWQRQHRLDSPYPLRHNGTNVHLTGTDGDDVRFASYLHVTQVESVLPVGVSSAIVTGSVRRVEGTVQFASMEVVLDMTSSVTYREARGEQL
ncbi:MAG: nuclear transport factor 2 family protein [Microthrixaceae bacterium]